jgi:hypothetical protein
MPTVTPETVRQVLRDLYGYEISADAAARMANSAGAMLTGSRHLASLGLSGIEPPFGYPVMLAEAARLAPGKKR